MEVSVLDRRSRELQRLTILSTSIVSARAGTLAAPTSSPGERPKMEATTWGSGVGIRSRRKKGRKEKEKEKEKMAVRGHFAKGRDECEKPFIFPHFIFS